MNEMENESRISLSKFFTDMGISIHTSDHDEVRDFFYDIEQDLEWIKKTHLLPDMPYVYETQVEQRGDGSGYETFFVFCRKLDGKFFTYYIYDGRIEEKYLAECSKKVVTKWDFECQY
jgi:hypothetical protein